ncbi:MAG: acyl-CoA dehydrogenase family protein, partial [Deltaproteobacteria bacterium]|nr:acyl-CoA dehydrogenase family protein [Deltaproteobacteria bacterium]
YAGISFPKEYGGAEGTVTQSMIVSELAGPVYLQALGWCHIISLGLAAPTILAWGNEEQKNHFLPKTLSGEIIWCQGFSEPNAGSDLAALTTRAVRDGSEYVINGQKIWSSFAHIADWCILVARTDTTVVKHRGLSFFLVDLKLPGIQVNPIRNIAGDPEFSEIFLDEVRVPESMRVGQEGDGWKVALTTLGHERYLGEVAMASTFFREYQELVAMAKKVTIDGRPASKDPLIRQRLAQTFIELSVMQCNGYRSMSKIARGEPPGPEGSIGKLFWSRMHQRMMDLAMEIQGPYHQLCTDGPGCVDNGIWQFLYLRSFGNTIEQGTSEIQRNIIGERVLGLPKDVSRAGRP